MTDGITITHLCSIHAHYQIKALLALGSLGGRSNNIIVMNWHNIWLDDERRIRIVAHAKKGCAYLEIGGVKFKCFHPFANRDSIP